MAKLSPQGPFRAFDADGAPLNGGKLYTYEAGTSTPKTTYTTESAVTPNTNPVILDVDGYASVWLGDGAYKLVLKNSADVTLWTIDNVVGDAASGFSSTVIDQGTNLNLSDAYANYFINCTAAITISLLAASSAGDGFYFTVKASSGDVVIDPNGAELIDGASTKTIASGLSALVVCNGSVWYTAFLTPTEFLDSTFRIDDNADTTKKIAFDAGSITTGTTRTFTAPDKSGTWALTSDVRPITPQGRLTLTSGLPVMTTTVSAAGTVYYTPYVGSIVPVWDGTVWVNTFTSQLSNVLANSATGNAGPAAVTTNSNYDLFVWSNAGVMTLTRGPAWSSDTARSASSIVMVNGIYLNDTAITNGPAAQRGVYVGTIRTNGTSTVDFILGGAPSAGGTAGFIGLDNAYNRVDWGTMSSDTVASYNMTTSFTLPNSSTGIRTSYVSGLAQDMLYAMCLIPGASCTGGSNGYLGMAVDSTTTLSGGAVLTQSSVPVPLQSVYTGQPGIGFHYINPIVKYAAGTGCGVTNYSAASYQGVHIVRGKY